MFHDRAAPEETIYLASKEETELARLQVNKHLRSCRIPDDCIDSKRYPLFMAREVMRQLIDNLCVTSAVHQGALS
jgi:hypothetical protein